jgi:hypothetical protein
MRHLTCYTSRYKRAAAVTLMIARHLTSYIIVNGKWKRREEIETKRDTTNLRHYFALISLKSQARAKIQ